MISAISNICWPTLIFCFLLKVLFLKGVLPEKSIITVYKGIAITWNEARCFCERRGGRLLAFETENKYREKFSSLKTFLDDNNCWIGLHDRTSDSCTDLKWHNTDVTTVYFKWGWNQPDYCYRDKCIRLTKNGAWFTTSCDKMLPMICENTEASCDFEEKPKTDIRLSRVPDDASMLYLVGNLTFCKTVCQNSTVSNLQCRGIQVTDINNPDHCYLFFIESPTFLDDAHNLQTGYGSVFLRRCCESKEVVLEDGEVEIIPNTETEPIDSCPEITTEQASYSSNGIEYDSTSDVKTISTSLQTTSEIETTELILEETTNVATQDISHSTGTTESHLDSVLATLISETKVEKKSTSASLRSRISVMETRTSATSMGLTASIIMSSILAAIIISDIPLLINHFRLFWCR